MRNRSSILVIAACFILVNCAHAETTSFQILFQGSCLNGDNENINLEQMKRSNASNAVFPNSNRYPYLRINNDQILYATSSNFEKNISNGYIDVKSYVEKQVEGEDSLDIELSFVELKSIKKIYWKETYQNRPYQQGILNYIDGAVESKCIGRGGTKSAH